MIDLRQTNDHPRKLALVRLFPVVHPAKSAHFNTDGLSEGEEAQLVIPYSFNLRYNVVLPMPSARAVISLSPWSCCNASRMACFSNSTNGRILACWLGTTARRATVRMCGGKSAGCSTGPGLMAT